MFRTNLAIEKEVDDTRSIRDMGASAKRKENQSSSSSRNKQKTFSLHESQEQGRGHQDQGQGQSFRGGDTSGFLANQGREHVSIVTNLDTLDGIALRGRDPRVMEHHNSNHQWEMHRRSLFLLTPAWAKGTGISPRVLHKHLLFHR